MQWGRQCPGAQAGSNHSFFGAGWRQRGNVADVSPLLWQRNVPDLQRQGQRQFTLMDPGMPIPQFPEF